MIGFLPLVHLMNLEGIATSSPDSDARVSASVGLPQRQAVEGLRVYPVFSIGDSL